MMKRVVIAGSRTVWPGVEEISAAIRARDPSGLLWVPDEWSEVICGMAKGADLAGKAWAEARGIAVHCDPITSADRAKWGAWVAPKMRNRRMAERADAAVIFWDGTSGGSADMAIRMVARERPVLVIPWRARRAG